jgi:hypothetical protein
LPDLGLKLFNSVSLVDFGVSPAPEKVVAIPSTA